MRARREPSIIFGLARSAGRHRQDHRLDPVDLTLVEVLQLVLELVHPGDHAHDLGQRSHLRRTACICCRKSSRVKSPPLPWSFAAALAACVGVERLLGLLDQGEHVAHAEDARGHPVGVEDVEVGELLAVGREHHLAAGHLRDRQRGTTARVAVELGQHDTGEADAVEERLRRGHGVLTDHRVDDEQDLVRLDRVADVGGLLHQLGVDTEAAGGVDHDDVVQRALGLGDRVAGDLDRVADAVARLGREDLRHRPARRRPRAG